MGLVSDPSYSQCSVAIESASHFLFQCDRFITLWRKVWGKSYLHLTTVKDLERFIKKITQIRPEAVIAPGYNQGTAWDEEPNPRSKHTEQLYVPCLTLELELELELVWSLNI